MAEVQYHELPAEEIERIRPLWEKLNEHHAEVSPHFAQDFRNNSFDIRVRRLMSERAHLKIWVAEDEGGELVGYAIGSMSGGATTRGELDSLYVEQEYRGTKIGEVLARRILEWFEENEVHNVVIAVATGNEQVLRFYDRLGFAPRAYTLRKKPQQEQ